MQVSFERRHVQLGVSVEVVFEQGLVDERVLHLRSEHRLYFQSGHGETRRGGVRPTHVCLDELRALLADLRDEPEHVYLLLRVHHFDHGVYHNEGPRPANAGAARTHNNQIKDARHSADGCSSVVNSKQRDASSRRYTRQSQCFGKNPDQDHMPGNKRRV